MRLDHLLSREFGLSSARDRSQVGSHGMRKRLVRESRKGQGLSKLPVRRPVVFPLSSCQGLLTLHIYNCIAEIENNYFNFAEGKKNTEDKRETEELGASWLLAPPEERVRERAERCTYKRERVRGGCPGAEGR